MTVSMTTPGTNANGRKIDTWRLELPDGNLYDVTVSMHTSQEGVKFQATCNKELLRGFSVSSDDINELRKLVQSEAVSISNDFLGASWVDAYLITAGQTNNSRDGHQVGLDLRWSPLKVDRSTPPSNIGEVFTLKQGSPAKTLTRHHKQEFEYNSNTDLANRMRVYRGSGKSVAVVDATSETDQRLNEMHDLLRIFNDKFLSRMSPDEISRQGIPERAELVQLMADANMAYEDGERIQGPGDDEFII
jgi:hypothetical protein